MHRSLEGYAAHAAKQVNFLIQKVRTLCTKLMGFETGQKVAAAVVSSSSHVACRSASGIGGRAACSRRAPAIMGRRQKRQARRAGSRYVLLPCSVLLKRSSGASVTHVGFALRSWGFGCKFTCMRS